jgi:hypothetical protein
MKTKLISIAAGAAALAACTFGAAQAAAPAKTGSCFATNTWNGWTAAHSGDRLYLRVGLKEIYQVDLTPGSHAHRGPGEFLVNEVRGSNWICSPLDLDLAISDDHGFRRPLIATAMRRLTPTEIAAIPRRELP